MRIDERASGRWRRKRDDFTGAPRTFEPVQQILKRHTEEVLFGRATPDQAASALFCELQAEIDAA